MRKTWLLLVLGAAVLANAVLIGLVLTGGADAIASSGGGGGHASGGSSSSSSTADHGTTVHISENPLPSRRNAGGGHDEGKKEADAVYEELIAELMEQKKALESKAAELAERERQVGVARAELQALKQQAATTAASQPAPAAAAAAKAAATESFKKLVKAFAGMEPDNAAKALIELYGRDRDGAVDLMLALPARKAAAVLDAVTARKSAIAAEISFEMSHKDDPRAQ